MATPRTQGSTSTRATWRLRSTLAPGVNVSRIQGGRRALGVALLKACNLAGPEPAVQANQEHRLHQAGQAPTGRGLAGPPAPQDVSGPRQPQEVLNVQANLQGAPCNQPPDPRAQPPAPKCMVSDGGKQAGAGGSADAVVGAQAGPCQHAVQHSAKLVHLCPSLCQWWHAGVGRKARGRNTPGIR